MQGNLWVLLFLIIAVVLYAVARASRQDQKEAEDGAEEESAEETSETAPETEHPEVSWAECQLQLMEAPPLDACDAVEYPPEDAAPEPGVIPEAEVEPIPESRHAANTAIRAQAWHLFRLNYRKILPLSAIAVLLLAAITFAPSEAEMENWFPTASLIFSIPLRLISLTITLGSVYAAVRVWRGEAPRPGMLLFFWHKRRFWPALGVMFAEALIFIIPFAVFYGTLMLAQRFFMAQGPVSSDTIRSLALTSYGILALFLGVSVWLYAWCTMATFQLARAPEHGAIRALRSGFHAGSKNFIRVLGMLMATGWPFAVSAVVLYGAMRRSTLLGAPWIYLLTQVLSMLLILFYGAYPLLALAGLSERLLPEDAPECPEREADTLSAQTAPEAAIPDTNLPEGNEAAP